LEDKRIGFKPSLISPEEHAKIKEKLNDPTNGLRGYVELQDSLLLASAIRAISMALGLASVADYAMQGGVRRRQIAHNIYHQ